MARLRVDGHLLGRRLNGGVFHYGDGTVTTPPPDPDPPANTVAETVTETV